MGKLSNQTAIVTGGTSGIGKAICELFASEGASVTIGGRNSERGEEVAASINQKGGRAVFTKVDVSQGEQVERMVKLTLDKFGGIDVLVNNAGTVRTGRLIELTEEYWDETINTNLKGVYLCCRHSIPHMMKRVGGAIVNIGSNAAVAYPGGGAYCPSKAGVETLTKVIALEYASYNIRANCIHPGIIETSMFTSQFEGLNDAEDAKKATISRVPLGRIGRPEEVAKLALYLASEDASYITGAVVVMDGGATAGRMIGRLVRTS